MKSVRALLILISLLALTSCREPMSPIVEATITYYINSVAPVTKSLTNKQIKELSSWLENSNSNWGRCFITPPGDILSLSLKHADGTSSTLAQLNFSNSKTTLLAQHLSGSNLSEQPCALQTFKESEISVFHHILELPE